MGNTIIGNTIMGVTLRTVRGCNNWDCNVALTEVVKGRYYNSRMISESANNYTQLRKCMLSKHKISLPNKADLEFIWSSDGVDFYKIPGKVTAESMIFG